MSPRLLDSFDMFWFSDWRTEAIWCTKWSDEDLIVSEGMLVGKGKAIRTNSHCVKYFVILMKPCKCMLKLDKHLISDYIPVNEITKLKECLKSTDNIVRDVSFNRREVYLCKYQYIDRNTCVVSNANLHKGLWIVTSPLWKSSPLREALQARKWWNDGNTVYTQ